MALIKPTYKRNSRNFSPKDSSLPQYVDPVFLLKLFLFLGVDDLADRHCTLPQRNTLPAGALDRRAGLAPTTTENGSRELSQSRKDLANRWTHGDSYRSVQMAFCY
jgi:hypothetical protein